MVKIALPYETFSYRPILEGPVKDSELILGFPPPARERRPEANLEAAILAGNPGAVASYPHKTGRGIREFYEVNKLSDSQERAWAKGQTPPPRPVVMAEHVKLLVIEHPERLEITQGMLEYADLFTSVNILTRYIWEGKPRIEGRTLIIEG